MKAQILVTHRVPQPALDMLAPYGELEVYEEPVRGAALLEAVKRNDYVLALLTSPFTAEVMDANPNLKIIANMAVGYDNIDVEAATARKIPVTNTPGVLTETTADLTWALLMSVARRMVEADKFMRAGRYQYWGPMMFLGTDVCGKTLGIVGLGRIGSAVARRAKGFGMQILYYDVRRAPQALEKELGAAFLPLGDLLKQADFVTIHTPLVAETYHLIGARELSLMKPTAFLINAARGPLVDEKALVAALKNKQIAGAALDVYEREPAFEPELAEMGNVVMVPHIGSASLETRTKMATMAADNIIAVMKGERPPNIVNPEIYG